MSNQWRDLLEADLSKLPSNYLNDYPFCIKLIADCVHMCYKQTHCSVESCNKRFKILNKYLVAVQTSGFE